MAQYQNNNNRNNGPKSNGATKEKGRQPDFDLVAIDDNGETVMVYNEDLKREVSLKIGAVWLGKGPDSPAFVKFNDGKAAKMFAKKPKAEGSGGNGGATPNSSAKAPSNDRPAQQPAAAPAQPARRAGGSPFGNRSK